jgi:hypothetical protein
MLSRVLFVSLITATISLPLSAQQPEPKALDAIIRTDYIPGTGTTVATSLTIQFSRADLQFRQSDGVAEATVILTGRITAADGRSVGRAIEELLVVRRPVDQSGALQAGSLIYNTTVPLVPGRYTLTWAARDVVGGGLGNYSVELNVPASRADALGVSSLILADVLEKIPQRNTAAGQFVIGSSIGSSKVRPKMDQTFRRGDTLGIYMQVYNLQSGAVTERPQGTVTYEIVRGGSDEKILEFTEYFDALSGEASTLLIEKKLKLNAMTPGDYTLQIKVTDTQRNETMTPSATFKVI